MSVVECSDSTHTGSGFTGSPEAGTPSHGWRSLGSVAHRRTTRLGSCLLLPASAINPSSSDPALGIETGTGSAVSIDAGTPYDFWRQCVLLVYRGTTRCGMWLVVATLRMDPSRFDPGRLFIGVCSSCGI